MADKRESEEPITDWIQHSTPLPKRLQAPRHRSNFSLKFRIQGCGSGHIADRVFDGYRSQAIRPCHQRRCEIAAEILAECGIVDTRTNAIEASARSNDRSKTCFEASQPH